MHPKRRYVVYRLQYLLLLIFGVGGKARKISPNKYQMFQPSSSLCTANSDRFSSVKGSWIPCEKLWLRPTLAQVQCCLKLFLGIWRDCKSPKWRYFQGVYTISEHCHSCVVLGLVQNHRIAVGALEEDILRLWEPKFSTFLASGGTSLGFIISSMSHGTTSNRYLQYLTIVSVPLPLTPPQKMGGGFSDRECWPNYNQKYPISIHVHPIIYYALLI